MAHQTKTRTIEITDEAYPYVRASFRTMLSVANCNARDTRLDKDQREHYENLSAMVAKLIAQLDQ